MADEKEGSSAPRARNRTVMLTPEMTGQLRSRAGREGIIVPQHSGVRSPFSSSRDTQEGFNLQEAVEEAMQASDVTDPSPSFTVPERRSHPEPVYTPPPSAPAYTPPPARNVPVQLESSSEEKREGIFWTKLSPVIGFLVSYDRDENGEVFDLRQGRVIVTSEKAAHGDYLVLEDETVSPMHAILRVTAAGEVQVLDQLSEHGTRIRKLGNEEEIDLSGERSTVGHGDVLSFGRRSFHVCMVVRARQ